MLTSNPRLALNLRSLYFSHPNAGIIGVYCYQA